MNITTARKIANDVGGHWANSDRRSAFHRLDISVMKNKSADQAKADRDLAQNIWNFFGNLAVKGKTTA